MPYNKQQKAEWQKEHRRRMKAAGYSWGWTKSPPKYSTVIGRITIKPLSRKTRPRRGRRGK